MCESITGKELNWAYSEQNRIGDHIWWISDNSKFRSHYPNWSQRYDVKTILEEIYDENRQRWLERA
jgi:CDP-paratose 2-epimerase